MRKKRAAKWLDHTLSWIFYIAVGMYVAVHSGNELVAFWKPYTGPPGGHLEKSSDQLILDFAPKAIIWFAILAIIAHIFTKMIGENFGDKWWQKWIIRIVITVPYGLLTYHILAR
jgi:hypothetical protein